MTSDTLAKLETGNGTSKSYRFREQIEINPFHTIHMKIEK